jgi:WD40 repeat protein
MAHDVFISYSARDKAVADAVCATLESRKIRCWIAPRDVVAGERWVGALIDAIGQSRVFVLVFSDGANRSPQVLNELGEAVERGIPIIPFRIEDVPPSKEMGYYIKAIHWLDAMSPPLEGHLNKLADTVQALMVHQVQQMLQERTRAEDWPQVAAFARQALALGGDSESLQALLQRAESTLAAESHAQELAGEAADLAAREDWDGAIQCLEQATALTRGNEKMRRELEHCRDQKRLADSYNEARAAVDAVALERAATLLQALPADYREVTALRMRVAAAQDHATAVARARSEAQRELDAGRFEKALRAVAAWLVIDPENAQAQQLQSVATEKLAHFQAQVQSRRDAAGQFEAQGDWDGALAAYEDLRRLLPGDADIQTRLLGVQGEAQAQAALRQARAALDAGDWRRAQGLVRQAQRLFPERAVVTETAVAVKQAADAWWRRIRVPALAAGAAVVLVGLILLAAALRVGPFQTTARFVAPIATATVVAPTATMRLDETPTGKAPAVVIATSVTTQAVAPTPSPTVTPTASLDALTPVAEAHVSSLAAIRILTGHTGGVFRVAFSPDGRYVASGSMDRTARVWRLADDTSRVLSGHSGWVVGVAFSPDGKMLATGSADGTVKLWNVADAALIDTLSGTGWSMWGVAFSPDGHLLAAGSSDESVHLWRVADRTALPLLKGHHYPVADVAFAPDGKTLISGSWDREVRVWRLSDKAVLRTLTGHSDYVLAVAVSPDGKIIASGSMDRTVRVWDATSGGLIGVLEAHEAPVVSLAFSPDGALLASGSDDHSILLWRMRDHVLLRTLEGHTGAVTGVAFSPDATLLASGSDDGTVRIWAVVPWAPLATLLPVPTSRPTATATPRPPDAVVAAEKVDLREGPGSAYAIVNSYAKGTELAVLGRSTGKQWLKVRAPDGQVGWVRTEYVQVNVAIDGLEVGSAPPSPTPSAPQAGATKVLGQTSITLVYVPAGEFPMGSAESDTQAASDEKPQHTVYLDGYWIGQTEVTNAQFLKFVDAGGYSTFEYWTDEGWQWKESSGITQPLY